MPEERQIGRRSSIDALEIRLRGVSHQWLIGERRIGKTSVARAVLARLQEQGFVGLDIDLSKLGIVNRESLAGEISRVARASGLGEGSRLPRLDRSQRSKMRRAGKTLKDLGFEAEGQTLAVIASLLGDEESADLEKVLTAIALHARVTGRHVFVLLDEVQLLGEIPDADRHIARWCREGDSPLVFIFAGSERAAVEALRDHGRPLAAIGQEYPLPEIGQEDWVVGLRSRFAEAEVPVAGPELEAIVTASARHPRRTMLIAANVHSLWEAQPNPGLIPLMVEIAIRKAKKDRAWS